jgi:hypothetical protein
MACEVICDPAILYRCQLFFLDMKTTLLPVSLALLFSAAVFAAPPANDSLLNATALVGDTVTDMVSNAEATQEPGDFAQRTVWWEWTAPANGMVTLDAAGSTSSFLVLQAQLQSGGTITSATGGSTTYPRISFPVAVGTSYVIGLGTTSTTYSGNARLTVLLDRADPVGALPIAQAATLSHDAFASRVTLSGDDVSTISYIRDATVEAGEPTSTGQKTVWWTYRPAATGRLTITTQGSSIPNQVLSAFLGNSVIGLRQIARNTNSSSAFSISFPVVANTDYQLCTGSTNGSPGTAVITLTLDRTADVAQLNVPNVATMANDNFAGRVSLTGISVSAIGYNAAATSEASDPVESGSKTLWWTYHAEQTGRLSLTTQGSTLTDMYAKVAAYLGSSISGLRLLDYGSTYNAQANMSFPVTAGTDYQISVGVGSSDAGGSVVLSCSLDTQADVSQLNVSLADTMANDQFANRPLLPQDNVSVIAHSVSATNEAGDPAASGYRTLWWTYRPSQNGQLNISSQGTGPFSEIIAVYMGNSLGGLRQVAVTPVAYNASVATVSIPVTAGTDYQISIGSDSNYSTDSGDIVLSFALDTQGSFGQLNVPNAVTFANDNFSGRISLTGNNVSALGYPAGASEEAGEPDTSGQRTFWWTYRPTANGILYVGCPASQLGFGGTMTVAAYQGTSLAGLRLISSAEDDNPAPSISFPVTANTDYQISCGRDSFNPLPVVMSLALDTTANVTTLNVPYPTTTVNDNFSNRATLTGSPVSVFAYNAAATAEVGEPSASGGNTYWWTYRPTMTGNLVITTDGSTFDRQALAVYQGQILSGLRLVKSASTSFGGTATRLSVPVTKDTDYQISFGSTSGSTGVMVMTVAVEQNDQLAALRIPNPASTINDSFVNSVALPGNVVSAIGYNPGATREGSEPPAPSGTGVNDRTLWWHWVAGADGSATVDLAGTSFLSYAALTVWQGDTLSALTQVPLSSNTFTAVKGQTYRIAVGSESSNTSSTYNGTIVLTVTGAPSLPTYPTPPLSQFVALGSEFSLSAIMDGGGTITQQWMKNGTAIAGATGTSYSVTNAALTHGGAYTVKATNVKGTSTSPTANVVVFNPGGSTKEVNEGASLTLTAAASGPGAAYRWRKGGTDLTNGKIGTQTISGATSATLTISPALPGDAGSYTCHLTMAVDGTDISVDTGTVTVTVKPKSVITGDAPPLAMVAAPFSWQLRATNAPTGFVISTLPAGLTTNTVTGLVTGIPTVSGTFTVNVSAKNAVGTGPVQAFTVVIGRLPTGTEGTFTALVDREDTVNAKLGGMLTVTVSSNGSLSGTLRNGSARHNVTGRLVGSTSGNPQADLSFTRTGKNPLLVHLDWNGSLNTLTGTVKDGAATTALAGRRHTFVGTSATAYAALYNVMVDLPVGSEGDTAQPLGVAWQQWTVSAAGVVTGSGRTAEGEGYTFGGSLWPDGTLPQFVPLNAVNGTTTLGLTMGSVTGLPQVVKGASVSDNRITGWVEQEKIGPVTTTTADRTYRSGIPRLRRVADGAPWVKLATGVLPPGFVDKGTANNARITFTDGGVESAVQFADLDQDFRVTTANAAVFSAVSTVNPCKVAVVFQPTTGTKNGLFTGTFTLKDGTVTRTGKFTGIMLSHQRFGVGQFTLPGLTPSATTSAILGGAVVLEPLP